VGRAALTAALALVFLTVAFAPARAAAQAPETFVVTGRVINGTVGADAPREGRVQVYAYSRERIDGPWEGQLDEAGAYRVEGIPRVDGAIYVLGTEYGGA
jgi:hypothetical protein